MHAHVTHSGVVVEPASLVFDPASKTETIASSLSVRSLSALPQHIGFVGLPDDMAVQPGCGFATLLPFETLHFDVLFSPTAKHTVGTHAHTLSLAYPGGQLSIPVTVTVATSAIAVSTSSILFQGTPLSGRATSTLTITNTSPNTRDVELLSTDEAISMVPGCVTLASGQDVTVRVSFSPREPAKQVGQVSIAYVAVTSSLQGVKDSFNVTETSYVRLELPVVAPCVSIESGDGGAVVFGSLSVGARAVRVVKLLNNSGELREGGKGLLIYMCA